MKRLIVLIAALMLITIGCHKDESEPEYRLVVYHGNGSLTANGESSVKDFHWPKYHYYGYHDGYNIYAKENMFTIGDNVFRGWSLSPGGTVHYHPGDYIGDWPECEKNLYAVWNDGETIVMCNGSKQLSSGKTYLFYDSGGPYGDYSNHEDYTYTFKAPSGKRVKIVFNDFFTGYGYDHLKINGTNYYGSYSPGTQYSSGSDFTVQWHSDGSVNYSGWSAIVTVVN